MAPRRKSVKGAKAPKITAEGRILPSLFVHREDFNGLCRVVEDLRAVVQPVHRPYQVHDWQKCEGPSTSAPVAFPSIKAHLESLYGNLIRINGKLSNFEDYIFPSKQITSAASLDVPPPSDLGALINGIEALITAAENKIDSIRDRF